MRQALSKPIEFGKYLLVERLARGGMAEIFKAQSSGPHGFRKTVVVKRIRPERAGDPQFIDMFIREANVMVRLNHPKIVQVLDFGEVDGRYFLVMEYVRGTDTGRLLQSCARSNIRLPVPLAAHIAIDVLDALEYAHNLQGADGRPLGIVHRDISPSNVFVSRLGEVKLADFGLATLTGGDDPAETGIIRGKYGYLAPEVVLKKRYDRRADIFAAGIVLAELLMSARLFYAKTYLDVLIQIRDARLDRLDRYGKHIPPDLRKILERALTKDPAMRYQSAAAFRDALQQYLFQTNQILPTSTLRRFVQKIFKQTGQRLPTIDSLDRSTGGFDPLPPPPSSSKLAGVVEELRADGSTSSGLPAVDFAAVEAADGNVSSAQRKSLPPSTWSGRLERTGLAAVLFRLATAKKTGLVVLQRKNAVKEIYLVEGDPEFVVSNIPEELFGQYLLRQGVLSREELGLAIEAMPRYGGKLGETLVALGLLRPMQMLRLLTYQVRHKMVTAFGWDFGTFSFHPAVRCPRPAAPLGLDAFEVIQDGIQSLTEETLMQRLAPYMKKSVAAVFPPPMPPERLRLGSFPGQIYEKLRSPQRLDDFLSSTRNPAERKRMAGMVYMLLQCGLAAPE